MSKKSDEISRFWDFVKAYVSKWHKALWGLSSIIFLYGLSTYNPSFLIPILLGALFLWLWPRFKMELEWSDSKIANLLRYREYTNTNLTPLEIEMLDRYFGNKQRRELIFDHSKKVNWMRVVYLLDVLSIIMIAIGVYWAIMPILFPPPPEQPPKTQMDELLELLRKLLEEKETA